MALAWDKVNKTASVMQLLGIDTFGLVSMIVQAAHTAHRNKDLCLELAEHIATVRDLLQGLDIPELMGHGPSRAALEKLYKVLCHAYELVRRCNEEEQRNIIYKWFNSDDVASELRLAQEMIDRYTNLIPMITTSASVHIRRGNGWAQGYLTIDPAPAQSRPPLYLQEAPEPQADEQLQITVADGFQQVVPAQPLPIVSVLGPQTHSLLDLYQIGREIGQGQFGTTYFCTEIATGVEFACKSISKSNFRTLRDIDNLRREIQILYLLFGHKNVVAIKGAYEDQHCVHIVMELCTDSSLQNHVIQRGQCSEGKAAKLTQIIVGVLQSCHSLGIMHRDLKPEKFLLGSKEDDLSFKAINFGHSDFFEPGQVFTHGIVGSPYYVAPEVLCKLSYGPPADVWAAGVILYILLSSEHPFPARIDQQGLFDAVQKGIISFDSDPWPVISDSAKDLIRGMLNPVPEERFTARDVLDHPWISDYGLASAYPRDTSMLSLFKQFSEMKKLKKLALQVIAKSLSKEEIGGFVKMFWIIDTDHSGTITFSELKEGLKRYDSALNHTEMLQIMQALDIDGNGTIDYIEFAAAMLHLNKLERKEHLVVAFSYFDTDQNGYVTVEELQQVCKELKVYEEFLDDVTEEAVQDYGGHISYEEFVALMTNDSTGEK